MVDSPPASSPLGGERTGGEAYILHSTSRSSAEAFQLSTVCNLLTHAPSLVGVLPFPGLLSHLSWDHFPNKLLALKSLYQDHLFGELRPRHCSCFSSQPVISEETPTFIVTPSSSLSHSSCITHSPRQAGFSLCHSTGTDVIRNISDL